MTGIVVNFGSRQDEIFVLVASDDLKSAIKRLLDLVREFAREEHQDDGLVLSQQLTMTDSAYQREEIAFDMYCERRSKLARRALSLVRAVGENLHAESVND